MNTPTTAPTRRKRGADENPFQPPDLHDKAVSPFVRRRKLLRWARAQKSISANLYKVIESILDRILATSNSLIGYDSVESFARRTGLCERSVEFALAELKGLGLGARLPASRLREWLDSFGLEHGFRFPDECGSHAWFTVLFIDLPPDLANRARSCALEASAKGARSCAPGPNDRAPSLAQDRALPLPIGNPGPSESGTSNRKSDGSLDPGGLERRGQTQTEGDVSGRAELEAMAADADRGIARIGRLGLARLGPPPAPEPAPPPGPEPAPPAPEQALTATMPPIIMALSPTTPDLLDEVRAMVCRVAAPASPGQHRPPPIEPGSRIWEHVLVLPGATPARVDSVARALLARFRDWNEVTKVTYLKYLGLVRAGEFPAELAAGLVKDACDPGVRKPGRHLSKALADEWGRMKNRSPGHTPMSPGDRL